MSVIVPERNVRHYNATAAPVMRETLYDKVTSLQLSLFILLLTLAVILAIVFAIGFDAPVPQAGLNIGSGSNLPTPNFSPPVPMQIESPQHTVEDKSLVNPQAQSTLRQVAEKLQDKAADVPDPSASDSGENPLLNQGLPGRVEGTGNESIFEKTRRQQNDQPEKRWTVVFQQTSELNEYAQQLDSVGIEPGLALPDGKVIYLGNLSSSTPSTREAVADEESRLHLAWVDGVRIEADRELFRRAGVANPQRGVILHFYSAELEQQLRQLESAYNGHTPDQIRRTVFQVRRVGNGYQFVVTDQTLK